MIPMRTATIPMGLTSAGAIQTSLSILITMGPCVMTLTSVTALPYVTLQAGPNVKITMADINVAARLDIAKMKTRST